MTSQCIKAAALPLIPSLLPSLRLVSTTKVLCSLLYLYLYLTLIT